MFQIKYLFFIIAILVVFQAPCYAQKPDQRFELQKAASLIESGNHKQATEILDKVLKKPQTEMCRARAEILSARILNENGDRVSAIEYLKNTLTLPFLNSSQNVIIKTDAYLVLAECYFGVSKMEEFKGISDTVLRLAVIHQFPPFYKARAYTNLVRYYAYNIIPNTGKLYLDSALNLYHKATEQDKKFYNPISLYTAFIDLNRDLDRSKLHPAINNVVKLINGGYNRERYNQTLLWRDIGGFYLDQVGNKGKKEATPKTEYREALFAYRKAATILKTEYPSNQIDAIDVNNLLGLLDFSVGLFKSSEKYFNLSKAILVKQKIPVDQYTLAYARTYLWESVVKDYVYHGDLLLRKREEELKQWIQLAPYWQKWQLTNQNKSLHYFRDNYARSPFDNIVRLCYLLYQDKKNQKYLELAFKAQESGKYNFLIEEYKKRYHITEPVLPAIQSIQHRLSPKQAVLSFSDLGAYYKGLYAVVITANSASIKKIDFKNLDEFNGAPLSDSVCKDLSHFKKYSFKAYQVIFKPLKSLLNTRVNELVVFPSTLSSYFKFGMMVTDTLGISSFSDLPYLSKNYHVYYDFSYQFKCLRDELTKQKNEARANTLAFIPNYSNTKEYSLPFFSKLGSSLKENFGFTVFDQQRSNVANYKANAGSAKILQLAGHSSVDRLAPENLKIAMDSVKRGGSRFLTMDEIINTKLQTDLTVLALCETGVGDYRVQDSYLNIAYWFTYAGSKSCLFSYWKLDDRSTSLILKRFYHYLSLGMSKTDALKNAQKDYLSQAKTEEEKNPVYWGGLTIIGDDSPVMLRENKPLQYWYWAVLAFIPLMVYSFQRINKVTKALPK